MKSIFYSLPLDIEKYIYSFDGTYRELFNNVLCDISTAAIKCVKCKKSSIYRNKKNKLRPLFITCYKYYDSYICKNCMGYKYYEFIIHKQLGNIIIFKGFKELCKMT